MNYQDTYYDHFSKRSTKTPPQFKEDQNYLMRFHAPLSSYTFENNNLTIIYFKNGVGELRWKNKRVEIKGERFIITNPSLGWEYINSKAKPIDVLSLVINEKFRKQFHFFKTSSSLRQLDDPWGEDAPASFFLEKPLISSYYKSGQLLQRIHQLSSDSMFQFTSPKELAIDVLTSIYQDQYHGYALAKRVQAKKPSTQLETFKRLLIAYEYIYDNINNPITLEELSNVSSLSKFHLYNSFKNVYGQTPHQYINRLKVAKAKECIQQGENSIGEIANQFGFNDISVFSKVFKKICGKPPSHYLN
ncbi:MAG: AraC family transcriptional regulator [Bacteroidota bacterium]